MRTFFSNAFQKVGRLVEVDVRALQIFRVALASMVLIDLLARLTDLQVFYTDAGVLPSFALLQHFSFEPYISFHTANGTLLFQAALWVLHALIAFAVLVGYRTKLAVFLLWLFTMSLHNRNTFLGDVGDDFLSIMLFYSLFLPLNGRNDRDPKKTSYTFISLASVAYLAQISMIYITSAFLKDHAVWHTDGTAILYSLHLDFYIRPWATVLRQFPELLKLMTFGTFYFELIGPLFVFAAAYTWRLKTLLIASFMFFHLGIALVFDFGVLSFFCMIAWIPFLPKELLDRIAESQSVQLIHALLKRWASKGPQPSYKMPKLPTDVIPAVIFTFALIFNIYAVQGRESEENASPQWLQTTLSALHIEQNWYMFAPFPYNVEGWFVLEGEMSDGQKMDLLSESLITWKKPPNVRATYISSRWNAYLLNLWTYSWQNDIEQPEADPMYYFAEYLCRKWDVETEKGFALRKITVHFFEEPTILGVDNPPTEQKELWVHYCYGEVKE